MGRIVLKLQAVGITSVALIAISGCASVDTWNTLDRAPCAQSAYYRPAADTSSALSRKGLDRNDDSVRALPAKNGKLTLADCIRTALEHNPKTRKSWQATRSAVAGVGQAKSTYLPSSDFTAGANRSDPVSLDTERRRGGPAQREFST